MEGIGINKNGSSDVAAISKKLLLTLILVIGLVGTASASLSDYDNSKEISANSLSGSPTISKAQPVYWKCGDDSTTGEGDIVIDCTNVNDQSDIAFVDEDGNEFLPYEHESFDSSSGGVSWVYDDWVLDGNRDAYIAYGNGSSDEQNVSGTWGNGHIFRPC